jgi:hypothetical protein
MPLVPLKASAEIEPFGGGIDRAFPLFRAGFSRAGDLSRHVHRQFLDRSSAPFERALPQQAAAPRVLHVELQREQRGRDGHAARDHSLHARLVRDLTAIADHLQVRHMGEPGDDTVEQSLRDVVETRVNALADKRQHRDGLDRRCLLLSRCGRSAPFAQLSQCLVQCGG